MPIGVRDRRRRVLADLGRGGGPADRAQRLRAGAGGGRCRPARARAAWPSSRYRGPLAITVPGAVRSWGDAHARHGRLSRADVLGPGDRARPGRLPRLGRVHRGGRGARCRRSSTGSAPGSGFERVYRPNGRPWRPGRARPPAGPGGDARAARRRRVRCLLRRRDRRAPGRGLAAIGLRDHGAPTCATHTSTWTDADRDRPTAASGSRRTRRTAPASSPSSCSTSSSRSSRRPPTAFGPAGVDDARWVHLGIEAAKLAMADRDFHLTDPEFVDVPVDALLDQGACGRAGAPDRPAPRGDAARRRRNPRGGGTIYLAAVDARRQRGQPDRVELHGLRVGRASIPRPASTTRTAGSYFSLDPAHPERASRRASGRSTRCSPGCCSGTASGGRGS